MNLLNTLILSLLLSITIITGRVIRVTDGDTIVILTENKEQIKVRLDGIDCPESKQDYGTRAKQATSDLCFNKEVRVEKTGVDRYGRTLGFVYVGNICVNKELLKQGMAWPISTLTKTLSWQSWKRKPEKPKLEYGLSPIRLLPGILDGSEYHLIYQ